METRSPPATPRGRARRLGRLLSLLLPALVAACDDVPLTSVAFRIEDPWAIAQGAMPLPVAVAGDPFPAPPARFPETVVRAMGEAVTWSRGARFVLVPAESIGSGLRIFAVFDGGRAGCGDGQAGGVAGGAGGGQGAGREDGRVRMQAVFCDGDRLLADVSGRLRQADGPNDRRFLALVRQVTSDLLQPPPAPRP